MRAARIAELGGTPELAEVAQPEAGDRVQLDVLAVALNPLDLAVAAGRFYGGHPPLPYTPGSEAVARTPGGDRVYVFGDGLGVARDGTAAEAATVDAGRLVAVDADVDDATAVALGIAGIIGWDAVERGRVGPGDRVLVLGASGTAGSIAVQGAKLRGADLVVAAGREPLSMLSAKRSVVIVNVHEELPPSFIRDRDFVFPGTKMLDALRTASRANGVATLDATRLASDLLGDSIGANVLMLGFAFQRGQLPVSGAALYRALELYGRNVEKNKLAFDWGRFAAENPEQVERLARARENDEQPSQSAAEAIARREAFLVQYQNRAYADRYRKLVDRVAAVEQRVRPGSQDLVDAVARNYFALLAYKDEYEVARLHTETDFLASLRRNFGAGARPTFHFSPPLFAGTDPATGRPKKYELGAWVLPVLRALAKLKFLRGTKLDPFGYGADRRLERALIVRYERVIERIVADLDKRRFELALQLARGPSAVRGFGPIKKAAAARVAEHEQRLLETWEKPALCEEATARASAA